MTKPGYNRLRTLAREASKETGIRFDVKMIASGEHKGTVQYRYEIWMLGRYEQPVTNAGSPAQVEKQFNAGLAKLRAARQPTT